LPASINAVKRAELRSLQRSLPALKKRRWAFKGDPDGLRQHDGKVRDIERRITQLKRELGL